MFFMKKAIQLICLLMTVSCTVVSESMAQQADPKAKDKEVKPKEKSPGERIEQFWLVILKTGPAKDLDSITRNGLFEGHMANINRLYQAGILKVAGPFGKNDFTWRGLFIFDCKTKEEAEKHVSTDPAVSAGIFIYDIVPWYGEAIGSFEHGVPKKP
jgi:uncharacterized protein YciI